MRPGAADANAAAQYSEGVTLKAVRLDAVPAVPVLSMSGQAVRLDRELDINSPVLLNFVFTTCSTTCSMQTAVLAELQRQFAQRGQALRLVSITIDPDNDTPEQLRKFSKSFDVRPGWQFLTGRFDDLLRVQRHFDVYRGSKAAHPPVVMMRGSARAAWVRMEGVASVADLTLALRSLQPAT
jgi:protein SCO1/2